MSLLIPLAAALVFACEAPQHHDGDAIRCKGQEQAMRMHAIDAPEMPGACRPGRQCTPGDPYASRDYLRSLTRGRTVKCEELDVDAYGRPVVRCTADGEDLGCAMVAAGHAVERYGRLNCNGPALTPNTDAPAERLITRTAPPRYVVQQVVPPPRFSGWFVLVVCTLLAVFNGFAARLLLLDSRPSFEKRPNLHWFGLAALGAGPALAAAHLLMDYKTDESGFSRVVLLIAGVQIGLVGGLLLFWVL